MKKAIAFSRPDGGVSIVYPAVGGRLVRSVRDETPGAGNGDRTVFDPPIRLDQVRRLWTPEIEAELEPEWAETEEEWLARIQLKAVPAGASDVAIMDAAELPDRRFREAWIRGDRGVTVDMPKARDHQMRLIRKARNEALVALDVEYMRADEDGDAAAKKTVSDRKRTLRQIPQTFDLTTAETPEQLVAMWPEDLVRPA